MRCHGNVQVLFTSAFLFHMTEFTWLHKVISEGQIRSKSLQTNNCTFSLFTVFILAQWDGTGHSVNPEITHLYRWHSQALQNHALPRTQVLHDRTDVFPSIMIELLLAAVFLSERKFFFYKAGDSYSISATVLLCYRNDRPYPGERRRPVRCEG